MSDSSISLSPSRMLETCCDWLLSQFVEPGVFRSFVAGCPSEEWYLFFYPVRTLLLGAKLLNKKAYREVAFKVADTCVGEQLPNGAFTSNFRRQGKDITQDEFEELLRCGRVNVADVGSNMTGVIAAAAQADPLRRERYLNAVRRWLDQWLVLWALPEGGYGNGIWEGQKLNSPYSCAMGTATMALSAFARATGEERYARLAARCIAFQCGKWCEEDGVPIHMTCYPTPSESRMVDYAHSFYLLEGMCWTHLVSNDAAIKKLIADRLKQWIFGPRGLLSQWAGSWFNLDINDAPAAPGQIPTSRHAGFGEKWEVAKSNGILHAFYYYLRHIDDNAELRGTVEKGIRFLSTPRKALMTGVMSDPEESYGLYAVPSTGFAGLSLAEAISPDSVFAV